MDILKIKKIIDAAFHRWDISQKKKFIDRHLIIRHFIDMIFRRQDISLTYIQDISQTQTEKKFLNKKMFEKML